MKVSFRLKNHRIWVSLEKAVGLMQTNMPASPPLCIRKDRKSLQAPLHQLKMKKCPKILQNKLTRNFVWLRQIIASVHVKIELKMSFWFIMIRKFSSFIILLSTGFAIHKILYEK